MVSKTRRFPSLRTRARHQIPTTRTLRTITPSAKEISWECPFCGEEHKTILPPTVNAVEVTCPCGFYGALLRLRVVLLLIWINPSKKEPELKRLEFV